MKDWCIDDVAIRHSFVSRKLQKGTQFEYNYRLLFKVWNRARLSTSTHSAMTQRENECVCSASRVIWASRATQRQNECACLKRMRKFTREKEWEWQYFQSNITAAIWRHFQNSYRLFLFRGNKPYPEQIRFPLSRKFLSNLLYNISFPTKNYSGHRCEF